MKQILDFQLKMEGQDLLVRKNEEMISFQFFRLKF